MRCERLVGWGQICTRRSSAPTTSPSTRPHQSPRPRSPGWTVTVSDSQPHFLQSLIRICGSDSVTSSTKLTTFCPPFAAPFTSWHRFVADMQTLIKNPPTWVAATTSTPPSPSSQTSPSSGAGATTQVSQLIEELSSPCTQPLPDHSDSITQRAHLPIL